MWLVVGCWTCGQQVAGSNPSRLARQVVYTHVPLSTSSIIWYRPIGGGARRLGGNRGLAESNGSSHLQVDCPGPGQAPKPYSRMGMGLLLLVTWVVRTGASISDSRCSSYSLCVHMSVCCSWTGHGSDDGKEVDSTEVPSKPTSAPSLLHATPISFFSFSHFSLSLCPSL